MESIRLGQKASDLQHALDTLLPGDEAALQANKQRHDSVAGSSHRDQVFIARQNFNCHASHRVRPIPVVSKTGFLNHGEEFLITQCAGASLYFRGER